MEFLKRKSTIESSFRAALVVMLLSELTSTIGPLVDGIIISAFFGESGVKEFGIINPLLIAYNALGSVFAVGAVTLCTRLVGRGKTKDARGAFSVAFFWILGLSVVITSVLLALADPLTQLLGASPDSGGIFREARNYYLGITVSFPAINLMLYLTSFMQVDNDRGRALASTIVLTASDIGGDLLVVLVLNGGMLGMGLATSAANYLALIVLLLHFARKNSLFKPTLRKLPWKLTGTMLSNGAVAFVTLVGNALMFIIMNRIIISRVGEGVALLVFTVQRNVFNILACVIKSVGRGVMTFSGFFYGEKNRDDMAELFRVTVKYIIFLAGSGAAAGIVFAGPLASLFVGGNTDAIPQAAAAVRIISAALPFFTANVAYECFFRGAGRLLPSIGLTILRDFLLNVVSAFALAAILGADGVCWAITIPQALLLTGTAIVVGIRCRKKDKSFIEKALFLPDGFHIPPEDCLYRVIREEKECAPLSQEIQKMCLDHGTDTRRSCFAALCAEEMCRNIIQHGGSRKKKPLISVRVLTDDPQKILLSIRDEGIPFSPVDWEKIHHNDEDRTANIGIRMTAALTEEMRYVNVMNLNSLYITL
ncbi:MAG: ATP-binding protein [Parasporobacterium sp.]|nr:ATP-binding protein [Parasporobacterium sp.]